MTTRTINKNILSDIVPYETIISSLGRETQKVDVAIDSRLATNGCVFFAMTGTNYDGHDFIDDALKNGAKLIIANKSKKSCLTNIGSQRIIFVENTLDCYGKLAYHHLKQYQIKKIAITGSNGKTTTKEMLKTALVHIVGKEKVYASAGNKNNHFGVPLSALEVNDSHEFAIFEMGMNNPLEISNLCKIIEPTFGLITNIGTSHMGNFKDGIDGVQRAKGELFAALNTLGHVAINIDDHRVVAEACKRSFKSQTTFGTNAKANIAIKDRLAFSMSEGSQQLFLSENGDNEFELKLPIAGAHHAMNAVAVLALVNELGLPLKQACTGLNNFSSVEGRMKVTKTSGGILLVDDAYNANPNSMDAGIDTCVEIGHAKRKIAVIASMGELGEEGNKSHFELGQKLSEAFDFLFICGEKARNVIAGAQDSGMKDEKIRFFENAQAATGPLRDFVRAGDLVFVKGSNSNNMKIIISALDI